MDRGKISASFISVEEEEKSATFIVNENAKDIYEVAVDPSIGLEFTGGPALTNPPKLSGVHVGKIQDVISRAYRRSSSYQQTVILLYIVRPGSAKF